MPEWVGFVAWVALALGGLVTYFFEDDDTDDRADPDSFVAAVKQLLLPLLALGLGILLVALLIGNRLGAMVALVLVAVLFAMHGIYFLRWRLARRRHRS